MWLAWKQPQELKIAERNKDRELKICREMTMESFGADFFGSMAPNHSATSGLAKPKLTGQSAEATAVEEEFRRQISDESRTSSTSSANTRNFFMDIEANVRMAMSKGSVHRRDLYKDSGWAQSITKNSLFEQASLVVVSVNALWLWIDTDHNHEDVLVNAEPVFQIADHFFCSFFLIEWLIRAAAFRNLRFAYLDHWFLLDTLVTFLGVLDTWVLTFYLALLTDESDTSSNILGSGSMLRVLRLLRLMRMARVARLLKAMPELMIMIRGMFAAMRSVFLTFCLLILLLYVFAIAFATITRDTPSGEQFFPTVGQSMYSLLIYGTLINNLDVLAGAVAGDSFLMTLLLITFVMITALTVMNMLIGVLCEVVSTVATVEKEDMALRNVKERLHSIVQQLDDDGNLQISKKEFKKLIELPHARKILQDVDVNIFALLDVAHMFFEDVEGDGKHDKEMSVDEFTDTVMQLRGKNVATVKDIMNLRKLIREDFFVQLDATNTHLALIQAALKEMDPEALATASMLNGDRLEQRRKKARSQTRHGSHHLRRQGSMSSGDSFGLSPEFSPVSSMRLKRTRSTVSRTVSDESSSNLQRSPDGAIVFDNHGRRRTFSRTAPRRDSGEQPGMPAPVLRRSCSTELSSGASDVEDSASAAATPAHKGLMPPWECEKVSTSGASGVTRPSAADDLHERSRSTSMGDRLEQPSGPKPPAPPAQEQHRQVPQQFPPVISVGAHGLEDFRACAERIERELAASVKELTRLAIQTCAKELGDPSCVAMASLPSSVPPSAGFLCYPRRRLGGTPAGSKEAFVPDDHHEAGPLRAAGRPVGPPATGDALMAKGLLQVSEVEELPGSVHETPSPLSPLRGCGLASTPSQNSERFVCEFLDDGASGG